MFAKPYASSRRYLAHHHEQAYLLAKGPAAAPAVILPDVRSWSYTGNRLHPTQKPVDTLEPLVDALCPSGGLVLDPFCGSGSSLVAAKRRGRAYLGIELDRSHALTARRRMVMTARRAA